MSTQDLTNLHAARGAGRIASPRNRLPGTVVAVKKDVDELDLKPGDQATAIVKSATVFIEPDDWPPLAAVT